MADVNNEVRSGEHADQKPKFKTNNVNVMFRQTTAEAEPAKDRDSASPGPAVAKPAPKSSLALSHGRFTLAAIREPSGSASGSPSPAPQAWQRGADAGSAATSSASSTRSPPAPLGAPGPEAASGKAASAASATSAAQQPRSVELNEEELTAKGISLAGRFHSASDMHWEDEEDDWMPPPNTSGDAAKQGGATKQGGASKPASAVRAGEPAKPAAPALKPAESPPDSSPWSSSAKRTVPPAARPLTETIKEMKEQKGHQRRPVAPIARMPPPRPVFAAPNLRPGDDALSRFRINRGDAGAPHLGRGPPPLNPRDLTGDAGPHHRHEPAHSRFDSVPDEADFSMFAKRKPLATPHDPPRAAAASHPAPAAAAATAPTRPAAVPERLRLQPEPAPAPASAPQAAPAHTDSGLGAGAPATDAPAAGAPATDGSATRAPEASPTSAAQPEAQTSTAAAAPEPKPQSKPEAAEPQQAVKSALEMQKEEMRAILAAAKAKREAEEKAEREKQERLARKREEYRREIEAKHAREQEEKDRARKERQAQREKERQEREEKLAQARREREQEREKEREKERERAREKEREKEREREREREREQELAHPVHSAGDWAAAKKKAGGPVFQQAWKGNATTIKAHDTKSPQGPKEPRFKNSRESWDSRKSSVPGRGASPTTQDQEPQPKGSDSDSRQADNEGQTAIPQTKDSEASNAAAHASSGTPQPAGQRLQDDHRSSAKGLSSNGNSASARASVTRHSLPVPVPPLTRPKNASFADEQFSANSRRPARVKLPEVETVGGFDVQEMMLLKAADSSPEFLSTGSVESGHRRQFREPLADRRPANVRMPGDTTPRPKSSRPLKGPARSKQYPFQRKPFQQHQHQQQPQDRRQERQPRLQAQEQSQQ